MKRRWPIVALVAVLIVLGAYTAESASMVRDLEHRVRVLEMFEPAAYSLRR